MGTLRRSEGVELPGVGWAYFVESNSEHFGEDERQGEYYVIFKIVEPVFNRPETFFRKTGNYQSWVYNSQWDGPTHEVVGVLRPRYDWHNV